MLHPRLDGGCCCCCCCYCKKEQRVWKRRKGRELLECEGQTEGGRRSFVWTRLSRRPREKPQEGSGMSRQGCADKLCLPNFMRISDFCFRNLLQKMMHYFCLRTLAGCPCARYLDWCWQFFFFASNSSQNHSTHIYGPLKAKANNKSEVTAVESLQPTFATT